MVYGLNSQLSRTAYFILIIIIFLFSKDTIFSMALLFILTLNPWGLFYSSPYDWVFQITPTVGIPYAISFALVILLKYICFSSWRKQFISDYLSKYYRYFAFYLIFLILWGFVYGHSNKSIYDLVISISVFTLFIVLPRVFDDRKILLFNRIIFGFCLIHTFVSTVDVITSGGVSHILVFERQTRIPILMGELVRLFGGVWIALYSLIASLYYLIKRKEKFNWFYLWLIVFASCLMILNTATRGWMMGILFLIIAFFGYYIKKVVIKRIILNTLVIISLGLVVLPKSVRTNINESIKRFSTVESVVEGDMTAGGTSRRWDVRGPRVLTRFSESPVFGFGFSKITSEYYDGHVGNHTLLLMGGIVGLSIVWLTCILIIAFLYRLEKQQSFYNGVFIFGLGLFSILIIHSTNMVMISYVKMPPHSAFVIAMLFNQVNAQLDRFKYGNRNTLGLS